MAVMLVTALVIFKAFVGLYFILPLLSMTVISARSVVISAQVVEYVKSVEMV